MYICNVNIKINILESNVNAYNKKTDKLLQSIGVDFPGAENVISYDENIAYTY